MNDKQLVYIMIAALGGLMGLAVSLSSPVTGFMITGISVIFALTGITINLKETFSDQLPSFDYRTDKQNKESAAIGLLAIASFIPFLFPQILAAIAVLLILAAVFIYYENTEGSNTTGLSITDSSLLVLAASLFFFAYIFNEALIIAPAFMFAWFIYTLLSKENQNKLTGVFTEQ
jgi:hypothetical protein